MKRLIQILTIFLLATTQVSCSKDDPAPAPDPNIVFKAVLNGSSESTPNASTATGNSTLTFNNDTKIFSVTTTHTVVAPNAAHIHKGALGVAGGVIFGFTSPASPIIYTSNALDATQEADLKANLYYTNVHTAAYPAGEIRGQLIRQ